MAEEKLLTVREVALILGISEKEVVDLTEDGKIPAYKVGGVYLRFKREQIQEFRKNFIRPAHRTKPLSKHSFTSFSEKRVSFQDRFSDFFYFNDFYIVSILIILLMLIIILRRY